MRTKKLRAIDLYAGVGGWSAGLAMAGIDVVASFERWPQANLTNRLNNGHPTYEIDIRALPESMLPDDIDIVVGSPPCTQFSYSNRGGGGDLSDGLKDIVAFLSVVDRLKPRWWVMENVPRAAKVVEKELAPRGKLARFAHLGVNSGVFSLEEFGLPQRRQRSLIGNIDFGALDSYRQIREPQSLGAVISALSKDLVSDPVYGNLVPANQILDHDIEPFLRADEVRINQSLKSLHPIYNSMSFPDRMDRPARTVTATCTRVSRESIIVAARATPGAFRRLTIRERASVQGFPVTYQFHGKTHSQKIKMVGNAFPPLVAYFVGHSMLGTHREQLAFPEPALPMRITAPPKTRPERGARRYPPGRRFRFAIPGLHFKSGVRFEFTNRFGECADWGVDFYFGDSRNIHQFRLDEIAQATVALGVPKACRSAIERRLRALEEHLLQCDVERLQQVWCHRGPGGTRPFDVLDELAAASAEIVTLASRATPLSLQIALELALLQQFGTAADKLVGTAKLRRHIVSVVAGILVGAQANRVLRNKALPLPLAQPQGASSVA